MQVGDHLGQGPEECPHRVEQVVGNLLLALSVNPRRVSGLRRAPALARDVPDSDVGVAQADGQMRLPVRGRAAVLEALRALVGGRQQNAAAEGHVSALRVPGVALDVELVDLAGEHRRLLKERVGAGSGLRRLHLPQVRGVADLRGEVEQVEERRVVEGAAHDNLEVHPDVVGPHQSKNRLRAGRQGGRTIASRQKNATFRDRAKEQQALEQHLLEYRLASTRARNLVLAAAAIGPAAARIRANGLRVRSKHAAGYRREPSSVRVTQEPHCRPRHCGEIVVPFAVLVLQRALERALLATVLFGRFPEKSALHGPESPSHRQGEDVGSRGVVPDAQDVGPLARVIPRIIMPETKRRRLPQELRRPRMLDVLGPVKRD